MPEKVRVAINGFGRVGRIFYRVAHFNPDLSLVAVNDLAPAEELVRALGRDSVYGRPGFEIEYIAEKIRTEFHHTKILGKRNVLELPWKDMGVDIVVDCTGIFTTKETLSKHLEAGAKRVVLSAPPKDDIVTFTPRINEESGRNEQITANSSCTTNAANPIISILKRMMILEEVMLTTVHAYTASQSLVDGLGSEKDPNRGRAAALNIIPSTTGAAKEIVKFHPKLIGKSNGISVRVPVPTGSLLDLVFLMKDDCMAPGEINTLLTDASNTETWRDIIEVSQDPLVSTDVVGNLHACVVDASFTRTTERLGKILAWYDNEMGYCSMLLKHVLKVAEFLTGKV